MARAARCLLSFVLIVIALCFSAVVRAEISSAASASDLNEPTEPVITEVVNSEPILSAANLFNPLHYATAHVESQFRHFIRRYGKVYNSYEEYMRRLSVFKRNLEKALHHQTLDPTAVHGVTPYSDLTEEEFATHFLGLHDLALLASKSAPAPVLPVHDLPANFDWRDHGAVTPVKTQGLCGACWAFTTTGVLEGAHFVATGNLINLSEQQLIDCDKQCDPKNIRACDSGCSGGLMTNAYQYAMEAGGLMKEEDYPYTARVGQCRFNKDKVAVKVNNFTTIPLDEDQIAANLVKHGPLAVGLNAAFMQTYIGGVSCPIICSKLFVNHGVLLVGYKERGFAPLRLSNKPYWILKNSWGQHWGEKGFYKLCRGFSECGMNTMVSAAVAASVDSKNVE